jgi:signal transduction histidine kinase/ActR/RegA family two-component response regulator
MPAALDAIEDVLGTDRAAVLRVDGDGVMRFHAWRNLSDECRRALEGYTPWREKGAARSPVTIEDVSTEPLLTSARAALREEHVSALTFVPLVSRGTLTGQIVLCWPGPRPLTDPTLAQVETLAAVLALTLDRGDEPAVAHEAHARVRLTRLAQGAGRLLNTLSAESVVDRALALAQDAIAADGYAVWRGKGKAWRAVAHAGLEEEFVTANVPADSVAFAFAGPVVAPDVTQIPGLEARRSAYAHAGIRALLAIPLSIRGELNGAIVYYFRQHHHPDDVELQVAVALGHLAAAAISSAELYAEQRALRKQALRASERAGLLAEVSGRLNSLDCETSLQALAQLAVTTLADWCVVDLVDDSGKLSRLAVAHVDPAKVKLARDAHGRYSPRPDAESAIARVLRTGRAELYQTVSDEILVATAQNTEHLKLLRDLGLQSAMLVPLAVGGEVFGVLTFVSATEGRHYDDHDLAFAVDLARRASYAIQNARLYQRAQEANRLKDEFLAALSHELRTPLNAIVGWTNLLRRSSSPAQLDHGLEVIERNAVVQARLVDDLLDASRIASGKMALELSDTDLSGALEAALATTAPSAAAKNIRMEVVMPRHSCTVRADPPRLQQVLWNLLVNAIKFTPDNGVIKVELVASPRAASVRISDSGVGIAPDFLPFIFDRFRQADASTTRAHRGLGLGLTLARQLTEIQGGRISAASDGIGKGSTFSVEFPVVERTTATAPGPRAEEHVEMFAGRHVLVVDDDPDSLDFLSRFLREQKAEVTTASSAAEGLRVLRRTRPDLLISDLAMPDFDGYWLVEQVRQLPPSEGGTIPAIALSAFATAAARERALASGFTAHLRKPLSTDELRTLLYVTCGWRGPAVRARRVEML